MKVNRQVLGTPFSVQSCSNGKSYLVPEAGEQFRMRFTDEKPSLASRWKWVKVDTVWIHKRSAMSALGIKESDVHRKDMIKRRIKDALPHLPKIAVRLKHKQRDRVVHLAEYQVTRLNLGFRAGTWSQMVDGKCHVFLLQTMHDKKLRHWTVVDVVDGRTKQIWIPRPKVYRTRHVRPTSSASRRTRCRSLSEVDLVSTTKQEPTRRST